MMKHDAFETPQWKTAQWMACAVSAVLLAFTLADGAFAGQVRNIIIIGWDGCQLEHLNQMLAKNELPNLSDLAKEGGKVEIHVTSGATDTKAGWSQILTGYSPENTGVWSNGRYQPIPAGYTIFERAEKALGADKIYTAMIVAKKGHIDDDGPSRIPLKSGQVAGMKAAKSLPKGASIVEENGQKFQTVPGKPYYNAKNGMDLFQNGLQTNEAVGKLALQTIEANKDQRMLLFIHFAHPDKDGHRHGENSAEYEEGIKQDDVWTGIILRKLRGLGIYKDTLVYVTADHGFDENQTSHKSAPSVFLVTNDKQVRRNGDRVDVAPTVLKRFGIDLSTLLPKLDGTPLSEVKAASAP